MLPILRLTYPYLLGNTHIHLIFTLQPSASLSVYVLFLIIAMDIFGLIIETLTANGCIVLYNSDDNLN